jgi:hypothetical protein
VVTGTRNRWKERGSTVDSVEVRVKRGARIMDERVQGWYHNVDLDTLDMTYSNLCVAGQAIPAGVSNGVDAITRWWKESGYWAVHENIEFQVQMGTLPPEANTVWAGFAPRGYVTASWDADAKNLAEAWTAEILERRHRAAATAAILEA